MTAPIELGQRVHCKYSGLRGTATQRIQYLGNPVDKIGVMPDSRADNGELPETEFLPENWLESDSDKPKGFGVE